MESPAEEEICRIHQLPKEVFDIIFSRLAISQSGDEFPKELRRVCKLWRNKCSRMGSIYLTENIPEKASALPPRCSFERLTVTFGKLVETDDSAEPPQITVLTGLDQLPVAFWEKFGINIKSLHFSHCRLGNRVMKNVILHGTNLESLRVDGMATFDAEPFCSPEMLEGLSIVQARLNTLVIIFDGRQYTINYDFLRWRRIFVALCRIFPNVTNYNVGDRNDKRVRKLDPDEADFVRFRIEFALDRANIDWTETTATELATSLAFSLSINGENWNYALDALSTSLSLLSVQLHFIKMTYALADKTAILKFFENHRELKSIQVELAFEQDETLTKSVFIKIISNCDDGLWKLQYGVDQDACWLNDLQQEEWSLFFDRTSKIEELHIGESITRTFSSCTLILNCWELSENHAYLKEVIQKYSSNFRDLYLGQFLSDAILQWVFQYMVNLKGLSVVIGKSYTTFGFTGVSDVPGSSPHETYSISRLRNLERLIITRSDRATPGSFKVDETKLFQEFDFPNLRSLTCNPPQDLNIVAELGEKMPLLKEVTLKEIEISSAYLVNFCRSLQNLQSLSIPEISFGIDEAKDIFRVCPSLKYLRKELTFSGYYYDPFTNNVYQHDLF